MLNPRGIIETTANGNAWRVGRMSFLRRFGFDNNTGWTHIKFGLLASWQSQTQGTTAANIAPAAIGNTNLAVGVCNAANGPYAPSFQNPALHWVGFASTPGAAGIPNPWAMSSGPGAGAGRVLARYVKNGTQPYLDTSSYDVFLRTDARSLVGVEIVRGSPNWTLRLTKRVEATTNNDVTDADFDTWISNTVGTGSPANHDISSETGLTDVSVDEATYGVFDAISIYVDRVYFPLMVHRMEVKILG